MGLGTELVFVEGHSQDDTHAVIERVIAAHPERTCQLHRQRGVGKGDAVRLGFAHAKGDLLMILDADLSKVTEYMANSPHPGKDRKSGHFGFAGHNDPVAFRNLQIRPLP